MDELLRFVAMRPAKPADPTTSVPVRASENLVGLIVNAESVERRLAELAHWPVSGHLGDYRFGPAMAGFGAWAAGAALDRMAAEGKLNELTGQNAGDLAGSEEFIADLTKLDDSLLVLKYRSLADGADVTGLGAARIGYDLVQQLAGGHDPRLRRVVLAVSPAPAPQPTAMADQPQPRPDDTSQRLDEIVKARGSLRDAIRHGLTAAPAQGNAAGDGQAGAPAGAEPQVGAQTVTRGVGVTSPWHLTAEAIRAMPDDVVATIGAIAGDIGTTPAPSLSSRLADAESELLRLQTSQAFRQPQELRRIGSNWYGQAIDVSHLAQGEMIGHPGTLRPVGVGDLMIVREHLKRYEGGEVGHIENVLRTEKMSRDTRRLDRTEQTVTTEITTDKEEERDTQSTDRFSLKRETDSTVKTDAQVKAGLSVDAKYGPAVEIKADLQGSYQHQTEDVAKQATEYSKDVVSRSVSKLVTKVRQLQTTITLQEFEEKFGHSFDNTAPEARNVSGVYQFVDKISEAQVYNYGKRLLFDVMVPEPAAFYIWAQQRNTAATARVEMPPPLTVTPAGLNAGNYQIYAQAYGATGIDPPPADHRTVSQPWDATVAADPHLFNKSGTLNIEDGYAAIQAAASGWWNYPSDRHPQTSVLVGSQSIDLSGGGSNPIALSGEQGTLAVGLFAADVNSITVTMEVLCESTGRAFAVWQEKAYATIAQAYQQRQSDYQKALAELQAAQAMAVGGRNPEANRAVIAGELRKACIEQLTSQHFDLFGAIGADAQGRPEIDLGRLAVQGPFERFFEEAFEWDRIVYFFYPYYWAGKDTWAQRSLFDDTDPAFADFLRAGGARVVFPVRPGFEKAIVHYLETGLIWNGGDPPDISSSLYLPIVQEVAEAEQRPGDEALVGNPWEVRVPTQLIKLRPDDMLPTWNKVAGNWVPTN